MRLHDGGDYEGAVKAFAVSDDVMIQSSPHSDSDGVDASRTAQAYVDALRAKDEHEDSWRDADTPPAGRSKLYRQFRERGEAFGMDEEDAHAYATAITEAWVAHKRGTDYWTPFMDGRRVLVGHLVGDYTYPNKPSDGLSGYGPEPAMYLVAVELHDQHAEWRWEHAKRVMQLHYESILFMQHTSRDIDDSGATQ
jgi:hypothetical protein